jgi:hypothetical protein
MPLTGLWTTSYSGWMRLLPWPGVLPKLSEERLIERAKDVPPMIVGHRWNPPLGANNSWFEESDGFVPFSTLVVINFEANERLKGHFENNQAGDGRPFEKEFDGVYEVSKHPSFNLYRGFFQTTNPNRAMYMATHRYDFLMTSADEIEFHWTNGSYYFETPDAPGEGAFLPRIARGTLTRVTLAP